MEALNQAYFLGKDELRQLARHPLVTVGAHTTSHAALPMLKAERARAEMVENKAFLEQLLGRVVKSLAYPYGACGAREAALAREAGFASAFTTQASPVYPRHRDALHALPRVGVRGRLSATNLYYRASGLSWALKAHKRLRLANA